MTGRGTVALVIIKGTNGGLYAVPATKLSYSNGTLSTTARLAGINSTDPTRGASAGANARLYSQGPVHASATGIAHANGHSVLYGASSAWTPSAAVDRARLYSQGPDHASSTGIGHANRHSVLYGSTTSSVATVASNQRRLNSRGAEHASSAGVAHASQQSVLYGASAASASGISVGMPLFSSGTQVGTVYRVLTANGVVRRVLVQGTNGRIYSLAPSALVSAGGSVTTTAHLRGI